METVFYIIEKISDPIIAGILIQTISGLTVSLLLLLKTRPDDRKKLAAIFVSCAAILLITIWGTLGEQLTLKIRRQTIDLEDYNGSPFDIILISDLHAGRYLNSYKVKSAVDKALSVDSADYVLLLGDVLNGDTTGLDDLEELKRLTAEKEVFFIYGNHDFKQDDGRKRISELRPKLEGLGIKILQNESSQIGTASGESITCAGIDDLWADKQDYGVLEDFDSGDTVILACHNPDCILEIDEDENLKPRVDLIVAGHTHGGQIQIPIIGYPLSPLPTELPDKYDKGLFNYNGIPLYITSGTGDIGMRVRLFNPPEIVVLTIR